MANMDQSGLHDRRPFKEQESDSSSKAETEVNFKEEQQRKKKTYGRTPDGSSMLYTLQSVLQLPSQSHLYATMLFYKG